MKSLGKTKKSTGWCLGGGGIVHNGCHAGRPSRNRYVRCALCGQRFEFNIVENLCCKNKHLLIPEHKATGSAIKTLAELYEARIAFRASEKANAKRRALDLKWRRG